MIIEIEPEHQAIFGVKSFLRLRENCFGVADERVVRRASHFLLIERALQRAPVVGQRVAGFLGGLDGIVVDENQDCSRHESPMPCALILRGHPLVRFLDARNVREPNATLPHAAPPARPAGATNLRS